MNRPDKTMKPDEVLSFLKDRAEYYKKFTVIVDTKKVKTSNSLTFRKFIDDQELRHKLYGYLFLFPGAAPIELKTMTDEYHLAVHDWMNVQQYIDNHGEKLYLPCTQFNDELNWILADMKKR